MEFPVSSGQQHRITEAWNPDRNYNEYSRYQQPAQSYHAAYEKQNYGASRSYFSGNSYKNNNNMHTSGNLYDNNDNMSYAGNAYQNNNNSNYLSGNSYKNHNSIPIATVLPSATQRQQQNYISAFHNQLSAWVSNTSKQLQQVNQNVSSKERNKGQLWAKSNSLTGARPLNSGRGMHLLQKMGWAPGEGLGREKRGSLQPLLFNVKLDRRGLVTNGERKGNARNARQPKQPAAKQPKKSMAELQDILSKKHPVTLLTEMAVKRKWELPKFDLVSESGTPQNKHFLFTVTFNGKTYKTDMGASSKKEARMYAARSCLQEMGILAASKVTTTQKQAITQSQDNTQNTTIAKKQTTVQTPVNTPKQANAQKPAVTPNLISILKKPNTTNIQNPVSQVQPLNKKNPINIQNLTNIKIPTIAQNVNNIQISNNTQNPEISQEKPVGYNYQANN